MDNSGHFSDLKTSIESTNYRSEKLIQSEKGISDMSIDNGDYKDTSERNNFCDQNFNTPDNKECQNLHNPKLSRIDKSEISVIDSHTSEVTDISLSHKKYTDICDQYEVVKDSEKKNNGSFICKIKEDSVITDNFVSLMTSSHLNILEDVSKKSQLNVPEINSMANYTLLKANENDLIREENKYFSKKVLIKSDLTKDKPILKRNSQVTSFPSFLGKKQYPDESEEKFNSNQVSRDTKCSLKGNEVESKTILSNKKESFDTQENVKLTSLVLEASKIPVPLSKKAYCNTKKNNSSSIKSCPHLKDQSLGGEDSLIKKIEKIPNCSHINHSYNRNMEEEDSSQSRPSLPVPNKDYLHCLPISLEKNEVPSEETLCFDDQQKYSLKITSKLASVTASSLVERMNFHEDDAPLNIASKCMETIQNHSSEPDSLQEIVNNCKSNENSFSSIEKNKIIIENKVNTSLRPIVSPQIQRETEDEVMVKSKLEIPNATSCIEKIQDTSSSIKCVNSDNSDKLLNSLEENLEINLKKDSSTPVSLIKLMDDKDNDADKFMTTFSNEKGGQDISSLGEQLKHDNSKSGNCDPKDMKNSIESYNLMPVSLKKDSEDKYVGDDKFGTVSTTFCNEDGQGVSTLVINDKSNCSTQECVEINDNFNFSMPVSLKKGIDDKGMEIDKFNSVINSLTNEVQEVSSLEDVSESQTVTTSKLVNESCFNTDVNNISRMNQNQTISLITGSSQEIKNKLVEGEVSKNSGNLSNLCNVETLEYVSNIPSEPVSVKSTEEVNGDIIPKSNLSLINEPANSEKKLTLSESAKDNCYNDINSDSLEESYIQNDDTSFLGNIKIVSVTSGENCSTNDVHDVVERNFQEDSDEENLSLLLSDIIEDLNEESSEIDINPEDVNRIIELQDVDKVIGDEGYIPSNLYNDEIEPNLTSKINNENSLQNICKRKRSNKQFLGDGTGFKRLRKNSNSKLALKKQENFEGFSEEEVYQNVEMTSAVAKQEVSEEISFTSSETVVDRLDISVKEKSEDELRLSSLARSKLLSASINKSRLTPQLKKVHKKALKSIYGKKKKINKRPPGPSDAQINFIPLPEFLRHIADDNPSLVVPRQRLNEDAECGEEKYIKVMCLIFDSMVLDWAFTNTLLSSRENATNILPINSTLVFPQMETPRDNYYCVDLGPHFPFSMPTQATVEPIEETLPLPYPLELLTQLCPSSSGVRFATCGGDNMLMKTVQFEKKPLDFAFNDTLLSSKEDSLILAQTLDLPDDSKVWPDVPESLLLPDLNVNYSFPFTCPNNRQQCENILFSPLESQSQIPLRLMEAELIQDIPDELQREMDIERCNLIRLLALATFHRYVSQQTFVQSNPPLVTTLAAIISSLRPLIISQANSYGMKIENARLVTLDGIYSKDITILPSLIRGPVIGNKCKLGLYAQSGIDKLDRSVSKNSKTVLKRKH